jgi:hypothetical protein
MRCVARTLTYISDITGFDNGEYFESPEQVRVYFKVEVMERLYPGRFKKNWPCTADLDEMARALTIYLSGLRLGSFRQIRESDFKKSFHLAIYLSG